MLSSRVVNAQRHVRCISRFALGTVRLAPEAPQVAPRRGQPVTLPAFMAPLGSLQVAAGRSMAAVLTSPGRVAEAGRSSPCGVVNYTPVGSMRLPPSPLPNGLASPGGLLPAPTAKSPPPQSPPPHSPHQITAKQPTPARNAALAGTPPRALGGTGQMPYPASPGQLSPVNGSSWACNLDGKKRCV